MSDPSARKHVALTIAWGAILIAVPGQAQAAPPSAAAVAEKSANSNTASAEQPPYWTIEQLADGVWAALQPPERRFNDSNVIVIENANDVVLVDALVEGVGIAIADGQTLEQIQENLDVAEWKERLGRDDAGRRFFDQTLAEAIERTFNEATEARATAPAE